MTSVISDWEEGSPIVWTSEFQGKRFEVRGTIVRFQHDRLLEYDHSLPTLRSSGLAHSREDRRVTIELRAIDAQHTLQSPSRATRQTGGQALEGKLADVADAMKALLEGTRV